VSVKTKIRLQQQQGRRDSSKGQEKKVQSVIIAVPALPVISCEILLLSVFPLHEQPQLLLWPSILFLCLLVMMRDIHHPVLKTDSNSNNYTINNQQLQTIWEKRHTCCSLIRRCAASDGEGGRYGARGLEPLPCINWCGA